jgi:hypothetical protein
MVAVLRPDHPLAQLYVLCPNDIEQHGLIGMTWASNLGLLVTNTFDIERTLYRPQVGVRSCNTAAVLAHSCDKSVIVVRFTSSFMPNMALVGHPFAPTISVSTCVFECSSRLKCGLATKIEAEFIKALKN